MSKLSERVRYLEAKVHQMEIEMQRMERDIARLERDLEKLAPFRRNWPEPMPPDWRPPIILMGKNTPPGADVPKRTYHSCDKKRPFE